MRASQATQATVPRVRRLLNDEQLQNQFAELATDLRRGSRRAKRKGAKKAINDRRVRRQITAAATIATQIARAMRDPEPPRPHPARRMLGVAMLAGGAAAVYRRSQSPSSATPTHPDRRL